jgi:signal transduction histidine kinase
MIKQVKEQKQHQSQDLRHMIANVAHDLKTVSHIL